MYCSKNGILSPKLRFHQGTVWSMDGWCHVSLSVIRAKECITPLKAARWCSHTVAESQSGSQLERSLIQRSCKHSRGWKRAGEEFGRFIWSWLRQTITLLWGSRRRGAHAAQLWHSQPHERTSHFTKHTIDESKTLPSLYILIHGFAMLVSFN